jgi:hypothetical protein
LPSFTKKLFGPPSINHFSLVDEEICEIPQLSQEENEILTAVREAILNMEKNKSPGTDGFSVEFINQLGPLTIIQEDLMGMFVKFQQGDFSLS